MASKSLIWTVLKILQKTTSYFSEHKLDNPRLNAERLLCHVLNTDRVQLYLNFDRILTKLEIDQYRTLVKRRAAQEPLQYITGETEFMGLNFRLTRDVLIPRPETETLVERVIELSKSIYKSGSLIFDIGTGSGCIAISLARYLINCRVMASDISQDALYLASENARKNQVRNLLFLQHDILTSDPPFMQAFDIVVSNPPYVSQSEYAYLEREIKNFEPKPALTDQADGLTFYRRILSLIGDSFKCKFLFLELSGTQTDKILKIARTYNFKDIKIINDLNQIPRVLEIEV